MASSLIRLGFAALLGALWAGCGEDEESQETKDTLSYWHGDKNKQRALEAALKHHSGTIVRVEIIEPMTSELGKDRNLTKIPLKLRPLEQPPGFKLSDPIVLEVDSGTLGRLPFRGLDEAQLVFDRSGRFLGIVEVAEFWEGFRRGTEGASDEMQAMLDRLLADRMKPKRNEPDFPSPTYSTLIGEGLSGSGFHFEDSTGSYLACSLHQFGGRQPESMMAVEFDDPIQVTGLVYKGDDIQVLRYRSEALDRAAPLRYRAGEVPEVGDVVYCYDGNQSYAGVITDTDAGRRNFDVYMDKAYPAAGNSGSPVVSGKTGTVVGVLLTADNPEKAREVGFEILTPTKDPRPGTD